MIFVQIGLHNSHMRYNNFKYSLIMSDVIPVDRL